jgi:hypothetical protein
MVVTSSVTGSLTIGIPVALKLLAGASGAGASGAGAGAGSSGAGAGSSAAGAGSAAGSAVGAGVAAGVLPQAPSTMQNANITATSAINRLFIVFLSLFYFIFLFYEKARRLNQPFTAPSITPWLKCF